VEAELPDVVAALDADGVLRLNPIDGMPDEMRGSRREDDDRFDAVLAGDVLEHLRDPLAVVRGGLRVLAFGIVFPRCLECGDRRGLDERLDDFDAVSRRVPVIAISSQTAVVRGSSSSAHLAPSVSASCRIERNFTHVNTRPCSPTRCWR